MKNFLRKHDIPLRLLCLFLAVILWAAVQITTDPEKTPEIRDIPINIEGADDILEKYNLSIIDGANSTVTLRIKGRLSDVTGIKNGDFAVTVDVSKIRKAGVQKVKYTVTRKNLNLQIIEQRPATIDLFVDEMTDKYIPVSATVLGAPAEGYLYDKALASRSNLKISGPKTVLDKIVSARVSVQADGVTKNMKQSSQIELLDSDGAVVDSPYVTMDTDTIDVSLNVTRQATLPLTVSLIGTEDLPEGTATAEISPKTITVQGAPEVIDSLTEISLGSLPLSITLDGQNNTLPIPLPEGVSLAPGQPTSAGVVVTLNNLTDWQVAVPSVVQQQTTSAKLRSEVLTNSVTVSLRGLPNAESLFTADNLRVEVAVNLDELGVGIHDLPITVSLLNAPNVRIVSYPQTVSVRVYETEDDG